MTKKFYEEELGEETIEEIRKMSILNLSALYHDLKKNYTSRNQLLMYAIEDEFQRLSEW
jgi:ribosomal protein L29